MNRAPGQAPGAVLFDMDGTLVDTERLWARATEVTADELGCPMLGDDSAEVVGQSVRHTAGFLLARSGSDRALAAVEAELEQRFIALVRDELVVLPGARELLALLREAQIATALVSASPRAVVDLVLESLGRDWFSTTVAAGETARTKPFPDPYLAAASTLGVPPQRCIAVEDSPTGVASAEAAGMVVLVVPCARPSGPRPGRTLLSSLAGVDLAVLADALSRPAP